MPGRPGRRERVPGSRRAACAASAFCALGLAVIVPAAATAASPVRPAARGSDDPAVPKAPVPPAPFTATQLPVPAGALSDHAGYAGPVACPKVSGCVVLGEYSAASGKAQDFIAMESGRTWTSRRAPLPAGGLEAANLGPFTLGCTGVGDCVGTSLYVTSTSVVPDLLVDLRGNWSARTMPLPANADHTRLPTIAATSCPGLGDCVIVGDYVTTAGAGEAFVVMDEKGGFVAAEAPLPGRANRAAVLSGVGCSAVGACVAVGYVVNSAGRREPLAVSDAADSLRAAAVSLPAGAAGNPQAELDAVSCGRSSACVALGSYLGPKSGRLGVIETELSGRWSTARLPAPGGASGASPSPQIGGVVCKVGNYCMAVGRYTDSSGKRQALALLEESGHWSASMLPGTLGTGADVAAVSCVSDASCAAVGAYTPAKAPPAARSGYVVLRSGATLSGGTAPTPANGSATSDEELGFVSCPWVATCTATGTYESSAHPPVTLPLVVGN